MITIKRSFVFNKRYWFCIRFQQAAITKSSTKPLTIPYNEGELRCSAILFKNVKIILTCCKPTMRDIIFLMQSGKPYKYIPCKKLYVNPMIGLPLKKLSLHVFGSIKMKTIIFCSKA
jgi:hypothetical protein